MSTPPVPPPKAQSLTPASIQDDEDIKLDETRRSPQILFIEDKVQKLVPPAKVKYTLFDWKDGTFNYAGVPVWVTLGVQFLVAALMALLPPLLVYLNVVPKGYPLLSLSPPSRPNVIVELLRAVWLLGVPFMMYVLVQISLCLVPVVIFYGARIRNHEIVEPLRRSVENLLRLRLYIALTTFGVLLAICGKALYPLPNGFLTKTAAAATDKAANATFKLGAVQQEFVSYFSQPYQFFIVNACITIAIVLGILLVEKILVRAVYHRFHAHGLSSRIATNKFARKVTKGLRKHFVASLRLKFDARQTNAQIIFDALGKATVSKEDFYPYLDEAEAKQYFLVLDPEMQGNLDREQFIGAVDSLYLEQSAIDKAFMDQNRIIEKFDAVLLSVVGVVSFFIFAAIMEVPIAFLVSALVGLIVSLSLIFGPSLQTAFQSIVFIIFTHPFDAEDTIVVDEIWYHVHELGLWQSTYITNSGQLTYIPNIVMSSKPIVNLRRSPIMNETISFYVLPTTTQEKIKRLEEKLLNFLKEHPRDYVPNLFIRGYKIMDKEHMLMELVLSHRANFNDMMRREQRAKKFVLRLRECIDELKIDLSPPLRS